MLLLVMALISCGERRDVSYSRGARLLFSLGQGMCAGAPEGMTGIVFPRIARTAKSRNAFSCKFPERKNVFVDEKSEFYRHNLPYTTKRISKIKKFSFLI